MLKIKDNIDLLESRISRANFHWNFFLGLNLAIIGWFLSSLDSFDLLRKIMLSVVLAIAYIFNLLAIMRAQKEMCAIDSDLKTLLKDDNSEAAEKKSEYTKYIMNRSFTWYKQATIVIYAIIIVGVYMAMWMRY